MRRDRYSEKNDNGVVGLTVTFAALRGNSVSLLRRSGAYQVVRDAITLLIRWPWLAAIPAAVFGGAYLRYRMLFMLVAALSWAAYACYEASIRLHWLCSGDCSIRIDLLLLYPLLLLVTLIGVISVACSLSHAD
jgi:hypothetical protein